MKLKIALSAVALIAGSAWAGGTVKKLQSSPFTKCQFIQDVTPIGDFNGDGSDDLCILYREAFGSLYGFCVLDIQNNKYLYISEDGTRFSSVLPIKTGSTISLVTEDDATVLVISWDGTSATSSNP